MADRKLADLINRGRAASGAEGAFARKLRQRRQARERQQRHARAGRDALAGLAELRQLQKVETERASLEHAEAFKGALLATQGAPHRVRVWSRGGDVRLYFPGQIGYLWFEWGGIPQTMVRGAQVFSRGAMWPSWRKAFDAASKRYRKELRERQERNRERWAQIGEPYTAALEWLSGRREE